jgi:hypothetical protein
MSRDLGRMRAKFDVGEAIIKRSLSYLPESLGFAKRSSKMLGLQSTYPPTNKSFNSGLIYKATWDF